MSESDFLVVIPARLNSSRIKHKPLVKLNGLPLVIHVCQRVAKFVDKDKILIATDNVSVIKVCENYDFKAVLTKPDHQHPLDRVCEVAFTIKRLMPTL